MHVSVNVILILYIILFPCHSAVPRMLLSKLYPTILPRKPTETGSFDFLCYPLSLFSGKEQSDRASSKLHLFIGCKGASGTDEKGNYCIFSTKANRKATGRGCPSLRPAASCALCRSSPRNHQPLVNQPPDIAGVLDIIKG
jgi:hypothetical protein